MVEAVTHLLPRPTPDEAMCLLPLPDPALDSMGRRLGTCSAVFIRPTQLTLKQALRWTEGSEALQIAFVMFIFPVIMNGLQYYIIDSFIKDPAGGEGHERLATSDRSSDDPRDSDDGSDDGYTTGAGAEDEEAAKRSADVRTKEMKVDEAGSKSPDRGVYEVEEGRGSDQNSVAESSKAK